MKIEAQHAATKTRWSQNKNKQKKLSSKIFLIKKETTVCHSQDMEAT